MFQHWGSKPVQRQQLQDSSGLVRNDKISQPGVKVAPGNQPTRQSETMPSLRDRAIPQKITFVIMAITAVVLLLAFGALFYFQACILKQHAVHELAVVGEITARECGPAVRFKDEDAANQILSGLKTMPQVVSARLELMNQQRLAFFGTLRDENEIKAARLKSGFRINGDRIILAQLVKLGGTQEATLYLLADLHATTSQLVKLYGSIFGLVLLASLLVAFVLSGQFLRFVTDPILRLADTARTVADHNDYSARATKMCNDEVGVLTDAFNQMLSQIQAQDGALRKAEEKYRLIFENAIEGMFLYYEGTVQDVTQRKRVEEVERASKAKTEFLSRVSHELRTPLNAILGFGQLLERQDATEIQRGRLRHIINAGQHLLGLINEVLDISRIETGKIQVSLEPVSVSDALAEA